MSLATFLTKFEFEYSRPFLSPAETNHVHAVSAENCTPQFGKKLSERYSEAESVLDIFSAVLPCVGWAAETFMSVLTI